MSDRPFQKLNAVPNDTLRRAPMSDTVVIDGRTWRLVDPIIAKPRHPAPGVTHRLTANLVAIRDNDPQLCIEL